MRQSAFIYARISRDRVGAGLGVDRQEQDCRELAERLGLEVIEVFVDNDISAFSGKQRPAYRALCDALRDGTASTVICWHTDRLHRSPVELEEWINLADPLDVVVHTVKAGPIDLATPSGRMVARQLGAVARYESEHRSERVRAQKDKAAEEGRWLGGRRPFGYGPDGTTLVPVEADLIRTGTEDILCGASLRSVVAAWNSAEVWTTTGKPWKSKMLRDVLSRWRNAGVHEHHGQPGGQAQWQAIVSVDQVRAVRELFADPDRRTNGGSTGHQWLLSGIMRCHCGDTMRASLSGAGRRTYRCQTPGPGHASRAAAPIDELVTAVIEERLSRPDLADLLPDEPEIDLAALRADRRNATTRLAEIAGMLGDGDIGPAEAKIARAKAAARLDAAEKALAAATRRSPIAGLVASEDAARTFRNAHLDVQRTVVKELCTVRVTPQGPGRRKFDPTTIQIEPRRV